jgi:all-trans-retinol dehydrogenase (NAD+)
MASQLAEVAKKSTTEPLLTGVLLYLLTKGPVHIRERLLQPFQSNFLSKNGPAKIATLITILKILTGFGVLKAANRLLNSLAWNKWALKRRGAAFQFGPGKEELVVITGGSSGFGYEMVKTFSQIARVVVLDVQAFPDELSKRAYHSLENTWQRNSDCRAVSGVHFYQCDLADTPAVEALCQSIREAHGEVSVLINNAGITYGKTILNVMSFPLLLLHVTKR